MNPALVRRAAAAIPARVASLESAFKPSGGRVFSSMPYFSRVKFAVTRLGASPTFSYSISAGAEVRAFGYGKGQDMAIAGVSGTSATSADTNITNPGETIAGQDVYIHGVKVLALPTCDFEALRVAAPEISVRISLNGDEENFFLGNLAMLPGGGGLYGQGDTEIRTPPLAEERTFALLGANGNPLADNYHPIPEETVWRARSSKDGNGRDGNLNVTLRAERAVTIGGALATRAAAAGVAAYSPPSTVYLDLMIALECSAISGRSSNR